MGSTKNTIAIKPATSAASGEGEFEFRDDWGAFDYTHEDGFDMPDTIRGKGASLCMQSAFMFEEMNKRGIPNHYRGLVDSQGNVISVHDAKEPINRMRFDLVRVLMPTPIMGKKDGKDVITGYDYSSLTQAQQKGEGVLVAPVEFIYREWLPEGSSMLRRMRSGEVNPAKYGFTGVPEPFTKFPNPVFDATTKYEAYDRHIEFADFEAMGISKAEQAAMVELARGGLSVISDTYEAIGMINADGKFEFVFGPKREIGFGDVVGALDEIRGLVQHEGQWVQISKEPGRQYYRITQPEWVKECGEFSKAGIPKWQTQCKYRPEPLDPVFRQLFEAQYLAPTNAMLGRDIFPVPPLQEVVKEMHAYFTALKAQHHKE
ncbi:MAG: hypothetical protein KKE20_05940 [Nanoarchaeota archaeon]|nr:hypothetical protein [Nanoarchaeota archaeon]